MPYLHRSERSWKWLNSRGRLSSGEPDRDGGAEELAALIAAQLHRKVQRMVGRPVGRQTVEVDSLVDAVAALDDAEETLARRSDGPETRVAESPFAFEVIGAQVFAQYRRRGPELLVHVADGLELPERLDAGVEGVGQDVHDENDQGHRHEEFGESEADATSHGRSPVFGR